MTLKRKLIVTLTVVLLVGISGALWHSLTKSRRVIEGNVEITLEMLGFSEEGITVAPYYCLVSEGIVYELSFTSETKFVGMENQKDGVSIDLGYRTINIHSGAFYRAQGQVINTDRENDSRPLKELNATYFECVKPGVGTSEIKVGGSLP
jgi:hypothetical protein